MQGIIGGLAQPQCYIFDQKRTVGVRLRRGHSRGRTSLFLPRALKTVVTPLMIWWTILTCAQKLTS